jgi:serine/threonine-protein kinase CTR1
VFLAEFKGQEVAVRGIKMTEEGEEFKKQMDLLFIVRFPLLNNLIVDAEDGENLYILTEYFPLGSLRSYLMSIMEKKLEIPMNRRITILQQVASTFRYLQEFKPPILHRDIKSENVLVSNENRVCLTDFGVSKHLKTNYMNTNETEVGTFSFTAPEMFHENPPNRSTDVYSFGIMMWEVLSGGEIPYFGLSKASVIKSVLEGTRPDLEKIIEETPQEAVFLMKNCWEENPLKRPSMKEVVERLKKILSDC